MTILTAYISIMKMILKLYLKCENPKFSATPRFDNTWGTCLSQGKARWGAKHSPSFWSVGLCGHDRSHDITQLLQVLM